MPCCIISNYAIWQLSNMAAIKSKQTYINKHIQLVNIQHLPFIGDLIIYDRLSF